MPQMALHSSLFARISATTQDLLQKNTRPIQKELSELLTPQQLAACPQEFVCPISLDIMRDPVLLLPTGQIYDFYSLTQWFESGGRSCPLTGMQLEGTVRMRYDLERRARVMAWLVEQGVDITTIPQLAKPTPTPQASEGDAGGGGQQSSRQGWDRLLRSLIAFAKFVGGTSKIYGNIY
ncbi:hypothetical protein CVIRNUC_006266 [Coccomyxa viridis]|uniref:U-box domain-containing protein n=1 Tax=Coccomyxa viridis TaxID=1274662 RepID=A0AAV1I860_9CHLO|nr:hypothetical protein CVIRNUC_006266 [Coccomyxa viridis]